MCERERQRERQKDKQKERVRPFLEDLYLYTRTRRSTCLFSPRKTLDEEESSRCGERKGERERERVREREREKRNGQTDNKMIL